MSTDLRLVILIVDDSELIMEKMIGMLEEMDHVRIIFQAGSYAEAAMLINEVEPDIVLMDIVLRDKPGIDLLKWIAEKYKGSILTAVLTNYAGQHYRDTCMKAVAHRFFDKSNDFEAVPRMIDDIYRRNITDLSQTMPQSGAK